MRPAAGRWRERTAAWRGDRGRTAATVSGDDDPGTNDDTTRLAQRHRFGRALDLPPWEPRDDLGGDNWLVAIGRVALAALAIGALAALIAWLT